jgi:hypothetical protein
MPYFARMTGMSLSRSYLLGVFACIWLAVVTAGVWQMCLYDGRPGKAADAPQHFFIDAVVGRSDHRKRLIMVVLDELALLMARTQDHVRATVVFVQYAGTPRAWVEGGLWRQASKIPGVEVVRDPQGILARRLGARTSGQTYLYDDRGRLLFAGGITGARGHDGDNVGYGTVLALLRGHAPAKNRTFVFGCALFP